MRGLFADSDAVKSLTALGEEYKNGQLFLERSIDTNPSLIRAAREID